MQCVVHIYISYGFRIIISIIKASMNKFNVLKTYRLINKSKSRAYVLLSLILTQSKGTSIVSDQHKIDTESWFQLTLLTMMSLTYALRAIYCLVSHTEKGEITENAHVPMLRTLFNTRRAANVLCVSYLFCALVLETSDQTFQIKKPCIEKQDQALGRILEAKHTLRYDFFITKTQGYFYTTQFFI